MKKRLASALIAICLLGNCIIMPSTTVKASNNDQKYDNYINMQSDKSSQSGYIVPNLYRQDSPYVNVEMFPLVVKDSVEYFPLDIFALYSYLQVVYSKITQGFYINNTKNNHYVAFDMITGTTTAHDEQMLDLKAEIFNKTYYVPAAKVCEILGMNFESYDDPVYGIRAARISDSKAKTDISRLVDANTPESIKEYNDYINNRNNQQNNTNEQSDSSTSPPPITGAYTPQNPSSDPFGENTDELPKEAEDNNPETAPATPVDPYTQIAKRTLFLSFEVGTEKNTSDILDGLDSAKVSAMFFVTKDKILEMPDTLRRIVAEGHSIGISFDATELPLTDEGADILISQLNEANAHLRLVTKTKTRFISLGSNSLRLINSPISDSVTNAGYELISRDISFSPSRSGRQADLERLISLISKDNKTVESIYLIKLSSAITPEFLRLLFRFTDKYPQFVFSKMDEYTASVIFSD